MAPRGGRWTDSVTLFHVGPLPTSSDSIGRFPIAISSFSETIRGAQRLAFAPRLRLAGVDSAEEFPAYSELRVDRTGHLWVRQYEPWEDAPDRSGPVSVPTYASRSSWDVFTPRGVWLGRVELPAGFTVLEIGSDYVVGIWRNADDIEFVRLYRLVRP
jgi:hypothetical protein